MKGELKVVIPARLESTRLPRKALLELDGLPMVVRVARQSLNALPSADVIVATDSREIYDTVEGAGFKAVLTRSDHKSGTDRICEVAEREGWAEDQKIINVQGDEPLMPRDLLRSFGSFVSSSMVHMATVSTSIPASASVNDPNLVKLTVSRAGRAIAFSRAPIPYMREEASADSGFSYLRHIGLYGYVAGVVIQMSRQGEVPLESAEKLEQLRAQWLDIPIDVLHWDGNVHPGVDTMDDLIRVRNVLRMAQSGQ